MNRHVLPGLRTTPLASYLAGLGLVRVLGEQAAPGLTARWTPDGLVVETAVADIAGWLADQYQPTPVLSPWNSGSGFGERDRAPKEALDALLGLPGSRLEPFRAAMGVASEVGRRFRSEGWTKERAVRELRNRCPEPLLPWIDAAVVLAGDQVFYPPLLGTGGNDGRLDFSTTFHQRLRDLLDPTPKARERAVAQARDLLGGTQSERLHAAPIGQFDPAAAGGRNSSPFGGAPSIVNPWSFVLLVEGALLFAATAVRRHQHGPRRAAIPFTVESSPDGSASGAEGELRTSRGEVWAPVWDRPFTLPEITQLFTEARASWRGRPARRAVEFYAATRTLGVARGVGGFERYGLHQRNGLAFVAVPIERVAVTERPAVRLAARLEDWVSQVRRGQMSSAVTRAVRRFDAAHLAFARAGDALTLGRLLAAVTDLELAVGRSGRAREQVPVRTPPRAHDFLVELTAVECPELRVAVGIASCATRPGVDAARQPARTMRQILLPVDPGQRWRDTPVVGGLGLRPLRAVLADVLAWRCRTALDEQNAVAYRGAPTFRNGIRVPDADLHAFAVPGRLSEPDLDLWLRACLALRWDGVAHEWTDPGPPSEPVPVLGLLHPFAEGIAPTQGQAERGMPRLALSPEWPIRLSAGLVTAVHVGAARRLEQAGWQAVPPLAQTRVDGPSVAAALVPRCRRPQRVLRRHLAVPTIPEEADQTPEDTDKTPDLAEEMS
jgi:CRISPR-associated protein Csx17